MLTDKKIITYKSLIPLRQKCTKSGKQIVLTMGTYDVLHLGHVIHFQFCKKQGDVLVVGLGNDAVISMLKGPTRPIHNQDIRARLVASLELVDFVVISEDIDPFDVKRLAEILRPDVFVIPVGDSQLKERTALLRSLGARIVKCRRTPPMRLKGGISTSKIVRRLGED